MTTATFTEADYAIGERAVLKEINECTTAPYAHRLAKVVLDAVAEERVKQSRNIRCFHAPGCPGHCPGEYLCGDDPSHYDQ